MGGKAGSASIYKPERGSVQCLPVGGGATMGISRTAARLVAAGLLAVCAGPAHAIAWRPADTNLTLALAPPYRVAISFGQETLYGIPVAPGIDPGAALTDPVALASADTLRGRDENALFGTTARALSPDESADDAGSGEHDPGANWYELVSTLSSTCSGCVGTSQTTYKLDLLKNLGLLPELRADAD
jgi:hypothetical protein